MSLSSLLVQTATVSRRTASGTDRYGNTGYDWADDAEYPARLSQLKADERPVTEDRQVIEWRLYLPPEADLAAADRVVVDEQTFEVWGDPYPVRGARDVHHLEANLRRVT